MLFINPMWDNEAERIGKQRCAPFGYALHVISDLLGFFALLFLFVSAATVGYQGIKGTFRASMLWLLVVPFVLAIVGAILYRISWAVAHRKGFQYNHELREASWLEGGQRRTYIYGDAAKKGE